MPLEDLTGSKFIADLNANWPLGTDLPDAGDDHLRGIKNVLQRQFPNLGREAVTLTAANINQGSVPSGSRMVFYQASAPAGWTSLSGITSTSMLRVVASTSNGGGSGGSDDPVLNNKVPSHTHGVNAVTTGTESADHSHTGYTNVVGEHSHSLAGSVPYYVAGGPYALDAGNDFRHNYTGSTNAAGSHQHTVQTYGRSAAHTHTVPTHSTNANGGAANWVPRYLDVIICQRS